MKEPQNKANSRDATAVSIARSGRRVSSFGGRQQVAEWGAPDSHAVLRLEGSQLVNRSLDVAVTRSDESLQAWNRVMTSSEWVFKR